MSQTSDCLVCGRPLNTGKTEEAEHPFAGSVTVHERCSSEFKDAVSKYECKLEDGDLDSKTAEKMSTTKANKRINEKKEGLWIETLDEEDFDHNGLFPDDSTY